VLTRRRAVQRRRSRRRKERRAVLAWPKMEAAIEMASQMQ
jgi:hypothetical protein